MDIEKIATELRIDLAYSFKLYGHNPDLLMIDLERVGINWYRKGAAAGIEQWRKENDTSKP